MANKLILKKSSVASKVPLATDLEIGELAVNLVDQKLYSKKADGTVVLVGAGVGGSGIDSAFRNRLLNSNFDVNQRAKTGTVTLSAGQFGHDRWKGGASGCTYTFSTSGGVTTITITAGSLVQNISGKNLQTATHVLSWVGTAQGRAMGGTYGSSGSTWSVSGGANTAIEFNTGTLSKVQFEKGSSPTAYEYKGFDIEYYYCCQYFQKSFPYAIAPTQNSGYQTVGFSALGGGYGSFVNIQFAAPMQAAPTITGYNPSAANDRVRNGSFGTDVQYLAFGTITPEGFFFYCYGANHDASTYFQNQLYWNWTAEAEI